MSVTCVWSTGRYEDLVARPQEEARRLFQFLQLPLSKETTAFIKSHVQGREFSNRTGTVRGATEADTGQGTRDPAQGVRDQSKDHDQDLGGQNNDDEQNIGDKREDEDQDSMDQNVSGWRDQSVKDNGNGTGKLELKYREQPPPAEEAEPETRSRRAVDSVDSTVDSADGTVDSVSRVVNRKIDTLDNVAGGISPTSYNITLQSRM